jgi:hypothetical protein
MQPSYIICKNCYFKMSKLLYDEDELNKLLMHLQDNKTKCPACGGMKFIRKVASKL